MTALQLSIITILIALFAVGILLYATSGGTGKQSKK